jgi:hypothetical protein
MLTTVCVGCGASRPAPERSELAERTDATEGAALFPVAPVSTVLERARLVPAGGGDRVVVLWLDLDDPFILRAWANTLGPRLHAVADRTTIELRHAPARHHSEAPRLAAMLLAVQEPWEAIRAPVWVDGRAYRAEDPALLETLR